MKRELLHNYINGQATDAEIQEVMQWAHENPANMQELEALRRINDEAIWNSGMGTVAGRKGKRRAGIKRIVSWTVAASILLLAGFSLSYLIFGTDEENQSLSVFAPLGQRTGLTLADGTLVWLNSGSRLDVHEGFNSMAREVSLDGEAYFSVTENTGKPFIVHTRNYSVKVTGTEFNVSSYANAPEWSVALVKGQVEVYDGGSTNLVLTPNMKAAVVDGKLVTSEFSDCDAFLWREGIISFEDASFEEIFSKLENYYQVSFQVEDRALLQKRSTCKFVTADGIECILDLLLMGEGLSYDFDIDTRTVLIK